MAKSAIRTIGPTLLGPTLVLLSPTLAHAGNEAHARTPVLWPSPACGVVVDRSSDPIVELDYAVPYEDTTLGPDELPDSRRHQFLALCRQRPMTELLPTWITRDDVDRAELAGLVEPDAVHPREILDESSVWAECFERVTADDERRPITFAMADQGVAWDTSSTPLGVWQVAGYTFEPALNLWAARPGFVKIVDDPDDPAQDLPAAAIVSDEAIVRAGEQVALEACVDLVTPGTALVEWARFEPQLEWAPLSGQAITNDGPLTISFTAPIEAVGEEILIRVRVVDALEREFIAHANGRLGIDACENDDCSEDSDAGSSSASCTCSVRPTTYVWLPSLSLLVIGACLRRGKAPRRADLDEPGTT